MAEGEPNKQSNEPNEPFLIKPEDVLESSVQRVVGGDEADQISVEYDFGKKMQGLGSKEFREAGKTYNVKSFEREKTPEELEITEAILSKMQDFMKEIGVDSVDIKPENIHILDAGKLQAENIGLSHSFEPIDQYVIISDTGNKLKNAQGIVHEALHFNSFCSMQIGNDKIVRMRRSGLSLKMKGKQELYFNDMNEAVITELERMFEAKYFDSIPGIQQDWKKRQDYVAAFLQTHPDMKELSEDVAGTVYNPKTGLWDGARYPYHEQRAQLDKVISDIYDSHKDLFENEDEVFGLFVRATFGGGLLDIARIVEETYGSRSFKETKKKRGEGSFRKLGRATKGNVGNGNKKSK